MKAILKIDWSYLAPHWSIAINSRRRAPDRRAPEHFGPQIFPPATLTLTLTKLSFVVLDVLGQLSDYHTAMNCLYRIHFHRYIVAWSQTILCGRTSFIIPSTLLTAKLR